MPIIMQASETIVLHTNDKELAVADAILADMQRITRLAAEPRVSDDSAKAAINRAARRLGISFRRARSFWYASPDAAVRAAEADRLRAEEARILVSRRIRLEQELDWIEARITARESRGNGGVAQTQMAQLLPVESARVDEPRQAHGVEEPIIDLRQMALPLRARVGR